VEKGDIEAAHKLAHGSCQNDDDDGGGHDGDDDGGDNDGDAGWSW
jgi:hypothetical protein